MEGFKMEQTLSDYPQPEWDAWADEQFSEDKIEEASENISNILALQRQRERRSPILFLTDKRGFTHDQEKMPKVWKIQGNDKALKDRKSPSPVRLNVQEMSR
jgi:hypothetical protein